MDLCYHEEKNKTLLNGRNELHIFCVIHRFSALSKPEDDSRGRFGTSPARGDGRGRSGGGFGRPQSRGITPRSSMEQEKERALAAVR